MKKLYLVSRNEILSLIRRPSFLFATFGLPLFSALLLAALSFFNNGNNNELASISVITTGGSPFSNYDTNFGYVDQAELIADFPNDLPETTFTAYRNELEAKRALSDGGIEGFFLVPSDYLQTGTIKFVRPEIAINQSNQGIKQFERLLQFNLLEGNQELDQRFIQPFSLEVNYLEASIVQDRDDPMEYLLLPYGITLLYYILILTSSSLLLSSITKEKESRLIEILMVSTTPKQLLGGKIIGLGLVGLFQTLIWIGSGYILFKISGRTLDLPHSINLTPELILWGVLFFLAGYALYASLMAAIGAIVPKLREATHATMIVISPMIIPIMMISVVVRKPNDWVALTLSMIPFTSPVTMMTRHATTSVPIWQSITSILLLILAAFLIIRIVARIFHAQNLLSGQPFNFSRFLNAVRR